MSIFDWNQYYSMLVIFSPQKSGFLYLWSDFGKNEQLLFIFVLSNVNSIFDWNILTRMCEAKALTNRLHLPICFQIETLPTMTLSRTPPQKFPNCPRCHRWNHQSGTKQTMNQSEGTLNDVISNRETGNIFGRRKPWRHSGEQPRHHRKREGGNKNLWRLQWTAVTMDRQRVESMLGDGGGWCYNGEEMEATSR